MLAAIYDLSFSTDKSYIRSSGLDGKLRTREWEKYFYSLENLLNYKPQRYLHNKQQWVTTESFPAIIHQAEDNQLAGI